MGGCCSCCCPCLGSLYYDCFGASCFNYCCLTEEQKLSKEINDDIYVWMNHNCPTGDPCASIEPLDCYDRFHIRRERKGVATYYTVTILILPSPYTDLNNHLFASFTKYWEVIDEDFVIKGGLGPHNLLNPCTVHNPQSPPPKKPKILLHPSKTKRRNL